MNTKETIAAIFQGLLTTIALVFWGLGRVPMEQALLMIGAITAPNAVNMIVARKQAEAPMKVAQETTISSVAVTTEREKT